MLETFELLEAIGAVRDENIRKTQRFLGYEDDAGPRRAHRKIGSALLIAAVLISLFTITAYALGLFRVETRELLPENAEDQKWSFTDSEGKELRWGDHCEHGFCFYFTGDETPRKVEFHPGWLPQEPTFWYPWPEQYKYRPPVWDPENAGWLEYLLDERQRETDFFPEPGIHDVGIPYLVTINYAFQNHYLVFNGACEIVKHETWEQFEVYELTCEKEIHLNPGVTDREDVISRETYVLLFSLDEGFMINIGGTSDLETLEHIARELEIRTTDEPLQFDPSSMVQQINIGLG